MVKAIIVLVIWISFGLYFGIGGIARIKLDETQQELESDKEQLQKDTVNVRYEGIDLETKYELKYYLEVRSIENYFPWAVRLSSFVAMLLTAFSFSLLGAVIGIIKEVALKNIPVAETKYWSLPLLGLLSGLVILGLSYLLPTLLIKNGTEIRPLTLMFLCLFGGIFITSFYEKLSQYFNKLFGNV